MEHTPTEQWKPSVPVQSNGEQKKTLQNSTTGHETAPNIRKSAQNIKQKYAAISKTNKIEFQQTGENNMENHKIKELKKTLNANNRND